MLALSLFLLMNAAGQESVPQCVPDAEVLVPVERRISVRYPPVNPRGPQSPGVAIFDVETDAAGEVASSTLKCTTLESVWVKAASRALPYWRFQPGRALRGQVVVNIRLEE